MVGYGKNDMDWDPDLPNGIVNIFSVNMPENPEMTLLKCQSEITACVFHPFEPSVIIGGTYSGSLVKWDIWTGKAFPVAKSIESTNFLINSINIVSPQNIISVSIDGTLVDWGDDIK